MNKNRFIPFGYTFHSGVAVINPAEAAMVTLIYELYADGAGYAAIANRMNTEGVAYHESRAWNKHMVKRILENARYVGADGYPAIISSATQERVTAVKAANLHCKPLKRKEREESATDGHTTTYSPSVAVRRLNNELNRSLERISDEPEHIKSLIFACAAEKYASLIGGKQHG